MYGANGYNSQIYSFDRQIQEERNKIADLEKQKMQLQYAQPTILNQTIQTGPGGQGIRYAESIDDVKREMVFFDTLFINKDFTNMWFKSPSGNIKTYLLEEFIPKDEKDLRIEALENEIKKMKEQKDYDSRTVNNGSVEGTVSETVPTITRNEKE